MATIKSTETGKTVETELIDPKTQSDPDSWEKLEEDLDKCIEESDPCMYYSPSGSRPTCAKPDSETCGCTAAVFKSIKERIHKLAKKEGE